MSEHNDFAAGFRPGGSPARTLQDVMVHQHDHTHIRRRFQPGAYVMSGEYAAAGSSLKMISIRLTAEAGCHAADVRYELALNVLATALIEVESSVSPAWTVQPAPGDDPLLYHLTPLQQHSVSISAAWEMTEVLRRLVEVASAEPIFVTSRGNHQISNGRP